MNTGQFTAVLRSLVPSFEESTMALEVDPTTFSSQRDDTETDHQIHSNNPTISAQPLSRSSRTSRESNRHESTERVDAPRRRRIPDSSFDASLYLELYRNPHDLNR